MTSVSLPTVPAPSAPTADKDKVKGKDKASRVAPKPDFNKYSAVVNSLNEQIEATKLQLAKVRQRISNLSSSPPSSSSSAEQEQRQALRSKLNAVKKANADKQRLTHELLRRQHDLQQAIHHKQHEINQISTRLGYSTSQQVQDRIVQLQAQINSGSLKVLAEKRAVQELSQLKRAQPLLDVLATKAAEVERDLTQLAEVSAQIDADTDTNTTLSTRPSASASSGNALDVSYDSVKRELDALAQPKSAKYAKLTALYQERDNVVQQLSSLQAQRAKELDAFRVAKELHYSTLRDDRLRKQAQFAQDKKRMELERLTALAQEQREQAEIPAFSHEIQVCTNLIDYVKSVVGIKSSTPRAPGGGGGGDDDDDLGSVGDQHRYSPTLATNTTGSVSKSSIHQVRQVEPPKQAHILKRGGGKDESDLLFAGVGQKKRGKHVKKTKASPAHQTPTTHDDQGSIPTTTTSTTTSTMKSDQSPRQTVSSTSSSPSSSLTSSSGWPLKLPLAIMEQFWLVKVDAPMTAGDVDTTISALRERRAWYTKHSPVVTQRNKAQAEARIQQLMTTGNWSSNNDDDNNEDATNQQQDQDQSVVVDHHTACLSMSSPISKQQLLADTNDNNMDDDDTSMAMVDDGIGSSTSQDQDQDQGQHQHGAMAVAVAESGDRVEENDGVLEQLDGMMTRSEGGDDDDDDDGQ